MNKERRDLIRQIFAGIFFIGSLVLIGWAVFVIGLEKGFTEPKFKITTVFYKVGGLAIGAPVRLSGVTIGTVSEIDFLEHEMEGRGVEVELSLFQKYKTQLYKATRIAIITEGVLGEKIVEITTDSRYVRDDLTKPVIGEDPLDVQTIAEAFGEAAQSLQESSETFREMSIEMEAIFRTVRRLLNRVEERVIEGNLFKLF